MLDDEALRGIVGLGAFIGFGGLVLAFLQPPNSAEQVLSVCSAAMGLALVGAVMVILRLGNPKGG